MDAGPRWQKYFSDCRESGREPTQFPEHIPRVLPGNEEVWQAFHVVRHCRVLGFQAGGFQWAGVAEKLRLHDLWNPRVEEGLRVCEVALLNAEAKLREKNSNKSISKPGKAAGRRR